MKDDSMKDDSKNTSLETGRPRKSQASLTAQYGRLLHVHANHAQGQKRAELSSHLQK